MALVMLRLAIGLLVLLTAGPQQAIHRIGAAAAGLAETDFTEVERQTSANGRKPWLFAVERGGRVWPAWYVSAYFESTVSGGPKGPAYTGQLPRLRRGDMQVLVRRTGDSDWTLRSAGSWAWVLTGDRAADSTPAVSDLDRPFRVFGEVTDDDIVSLVDFVRAPDPAPPASTELAGELRLPGSVSLTAPRMPRGKPISQISKQRPGEAVTVWFGATPGFGSGEIATLVPFNGTWRLSSVGWFAT